MNDNVIITVNRSCNLFPDPYKYRFLYFFTYPENVEFMLHDEENLLNCHNVLLTYISDRMLEGFISEESFDKHLPIMINDCFSEYIKESYLYFFSDVKVDTTYDKNNITLKFSLSINEEHVVFAFSFTYLKI